MAEHRADGVAHRRGQVDGGSRILRRQFREIARITHCRTKGVQRGCATKGVGLLSMEPDRTAAS